MTAIKSITIENLQRLQNITVDFAETGVTAIMGANGTGKTTLLQALACVYRRDTRLDLEQVNAQYSDFFKVYPGNDWNGTRFDVSFYDREDSVPYEKTEGVWSPSTEHKTQRYVKFISISDCVPDQEKETELDIGEFQKSEIGLSAAKKRTLLQNASGALNRSFEDAGYGNKDQGLASFFYAQTKNRAGLVLDYPSHYMGSGEQKVFHIINEVLKAPRGALILIEELDISLHESAIRALINFLLQQANDDRRQLQIVFSTHWLGIQDFVEQVNVFSLYEESKNQTIEVRDGFDPQFVFSLNGNYQSLRQIKVWVEDGLAVKIIEQVAMDAGLREFVDVKNFGSVQNAYTIAGSIAVSGEALDRTLVVTDGDRYIDAAEKQTQINSKIDGGGQQERAWRQAALDIVLDLDAPNQAQPEKVILDLCREYAEQPGAPEWLRNDLTWIAHQIPRIDGKSAMNSLRLHKNMSMDRVEAMFIQEAMHAEGWVNYITPLIHGLNQAALNVGLPARAEEEE
ncbi:AAA family ATPase [Vibrio sp. 99-8-1]|uniref:ATP-dependent nuclease n=1 Tax=Vibrio sp. 99-8-1 TaxID=2607602 RepID=UPI001493C03E|nr:AAA family ATPase [Vibrio sp. 99-8-1]NOI66464.1 ATP-binding protein [Vibrio sp. 99-8-1]